MQIIKAPDLSSALFPTKVFLAGGITKCANWQKQLEYELQSLPISLYNPRRDKMPKGDSNAIAQIYWEYDRLRLVDVIVFWFAPETVCPITLFELGAALYRRETQKVIVGCHPSYKRLLDVKTQCMLQKQTIIVGFADFVTSVKFEIEHL